MQDGCLFTAKNDAGNIEDNWGIFVRFFFYGTFYSFDQQPCGNSCFTNIYGEYSTPASDELVLSVDSVNFNCSMAGGTNETEIRNGAKIRFKILNYSLDGFQLEKLFNCPAKSLDN
ncbi:MAG: hypothetical protein LBS08_05225 [Candidatus Symbiothrix sp.]|nr:hypothetical protein [Candidatus Symbiothrix sp.]